MGRSGWGGCNGKAGIGHPSADIRRGPSGDVCYGCSTGVEIGQDPSSRNGRGIDGAGVGCSEWGGLG